MNKFLLTIALFSCQSFRLFSQETWITWHEGNEVVFSVSAPSGLLKYESLNNHKLTYYEYGPNTGKIRSIGNVRIEYYEYGILVGKIRKIHYTSINYEEYGKNIGRVKSVGNARVYYEDYGVNEGRIKSITGKVN